jgi:hypothetical protein
MYKKKKIEKLKMLNEIRKESEDKTKSKSTQRNESMRTRKGGEK